MLDHRHGDQHYVSRPQNRRSDVIRPVRHDGRKGDERAAVEASLDHIEYPSSAVSDTSAKAGVIRAGFCVESGESAGYCSR